MNIKRKDKSESINSFGVDTKIQGKDVVQFIADMIERNEKNEVEIEQGKLTISLLKQMNNRSRLLLDIARYELQKKEINKRDE